MNDWQPIETAPAYQMILVTGPSGYSTHREFVINAYRDPEYRGGDRWLDSTNESLGDKGWAPTHWRPLPALPDVHSERDI